MVWDEGAAFLVLQEVEEESLAILSLKNASAGCHFWEWGMAGPVHLAIFCPFN